MFDSYIIMVDHYHRNSILNRNNLDQLIVNYFSLIKDRLKYFLFAELIEFENVLYHLLLNLNFLLIDQDL
jgi:hypothetical protein